MEPTMKQTQLKQGYRCTAWIFKVEQQQKKTRAIIRRTLKAI